MITKEQVIEVCKDYNDPELGVDVWTLGLIYDVSIADNKVNMRMTFTSPMCPYGPTMVSTLISMIKNKGADDVEIEVTFDPPWKPSEDLREMLGV